MKIRETALFLAIPLIAASLWNASCDNSGGFTENVDITVCEPSEGPFTLNIDNPYFPLQVGTELVLEGDEGGTPIQLEFTVLNETEVVAGVTTRVVEERHTEDGELVEVSRNFFVQAPDGSVCYYGEDVDIYEGGVIVAHDGAWRAGVDDAIPGIFMPALPEVGQAFRQEVAPGVAEDQVEIQATGESTTTPAGTFTDTVRFFETTPLEPGVTSTKVFARDIGLIVDDVAELTSVTP